MSRDSTHTDPDTDKELWTALLSLQRLRLPPVSGLERPKTLKPFGQAALVMMEGDKND